VVPLFLFDKPGSNWLPKTPPEPGFGEPRWDWPTPFDLEYTCLLAEQDRMWAWQPRNIPNMFTAPREPLAFHDDRNATLLRFEPGRRQALPVALRFEKDGQGSDPFAARQNSYMGWFNGLRPPLPHHLVIPQGLVLSCAWATPGHWLASKADLDSRLEELRAKLPKPAVTGGSK